MERYVTQSFSPTHSHLQTSNQKLTSRPKVYCPQRAKIGTPMPVPPVPMSSLAFVGIPKFKVSLPKTPSSLHADSLFVLPKHRSNAKSLLQLVRWAAALSLRVPPLPDARTMKLAQALHPAHLVSLFKVLKADDALLCMTVSRHAVLFSRRVHHHSTRTAARRSWTRAFRSCSDGFSSRRS